MPTFEIDEFVLVCTDNGNVWVQIIDVSGIDEDAEYEGRVTENASILFSGAAIIADGRIK